MDLVGYMKSGVKVEGVLYNRANGQCKIVHFDGNQDLARVTDVQVPWNRAQDIKLVFEFINMYILQFSLVPTVNVYWAHLNCSHISLLFMLFILYP